MNVAVYEHCPDIPVRLRQRGDEILGHGVTNSEEQGHLDEAAERDLIQRVTSTIERHEGAREIAADEPEPAGDHDAAAAIEISVVGRAPAHDRLRPQGLA